MTTTVPKDFKLSPHSLYQLRNGITVAEVIDRINKETIETEQKTTQVAFNILRNHALKELKGDKEAYEKAESCCLKHKNICILTGILTEGCSNEDAAKRLRSNDEHIASFVKTNLKTKGGRSTLRELYKTIALRPLDEDFEKGRCTKTRDMTKKIGKEVEAFQEKFLVLEKNARKSLTTITNELEAAENTDFQKYKVVCIVTKILAEDCTFSDAKEKLQNDDELIASFVAENFGETKLGNLYKKLGKSAFPGLFEKDDMNFSSVTKTDKIAWQLFSRCNKTFAPPGSGRFLFPDKTNTHHDLLFFAKVTKTLPLGETATKTNIFVFTEGASAHTHLIRFTTKMPRELGSRCLTTITLEDRRRILIGEHSSRISYINKTEELYSAVLNYTKEVKGALIKGGDIPESFQGAEVTIAQRHIKIHKSSSIGDIEMFLLFLSNKLNSLKVRDEMAFLNYLMEVSDPSLKKEIIKALEENVQKSLREAIQKKSKHLLRKP